MSPEVSHCQWGRQLPLVRLHWLPLYLDFYLSSLYMRTGPLCCCKLPHNSAGQIVMKMAFVWKMNYSQKAYSHLQSDKKKKKKILTAFKSSSWISNILEGFSQISQDWNYDWGYGCMNLNGFDYSRRPSLYVFKSTWLVASFPGSQWKFLLCSFLHTAYGVAMNIFSIFHAQGDKPKPSEFSYGCCYL